jgi:hypothetical protein
MDVVLIAESYGKFPSMERRSSSDWIFFIYICFNWNVVESSDDFDCKKFGYWSVIISINCDKIFDEICTARTNIEAKLTG